MRSVPGRWRPLQEFFAVLQAPLLEAGVGGLFLVEACGPDGQDWTSIRPVAVSLRGDDPALVAAWAVAQLCGATREQPDPGPPGQRGHGIYYVASALLGPRRADASVAALGAIILDIDDRDHGGRPGVLAALARVPKPTALARSGGGVQAAYVLREAVVFGRGDEAALAAAARRYLAAALALQAATGADATAWPSHLFRCPATYHLKDPSRPILVEVDLDRRRRFNLADFDDLAGGVDDAALRGHAEKLVARLTGRKGCLGSLGSLAPLATAARSPGGKPRVVLPRRVSPATVRLLNEGRHSKYERADGSLDRSRAVYAAALSLLAAGLTEERVASAIAASALRPALEDRGDDAMRWLSFQIEAAREYLAKSAAKGRNA